MTLFDDGVVTMEVPDEWVNRSVVVLVEPLPPGETLPAQIMLSRDACSATDTLENRTVWAIRQLVDLPELSLTEKNTYHLDDGTPAAQLLVEWMHPAGKRTELITLFLRRGTFWTFTAAIPSARLDELDPLMQAVLGSFTVST